VEVTTLGWFHSLVGRLRDFIAISSRDFWGTFSLTNLHFVIFFSDVHLFPRSVAMLCFEFAGTLPRHASEVYLAKIS
jgi:hypothetical protein